MEQISNDHLQVKISQNGAELKSITGLHTHTEYLWQADPAYWERSSPILFPIVGSLWQGEAHIDGQAFKLPKHGFVSLAKFLCIEHTETFVKYRFTENKETLHVFPFPFTLETSFSLCGNRVEVEWTVLNTGLKPLPFNLGGHPGINYPNFKAEDEVRGYLSFDTAEPLECATVGASGCIASERYLLPSTNGMTPITDDLFKVDTVIIDRHQTKSVTLNQMNKKPYVTLCSDAPCSLIWSPYGKKSPFVCLEPWYGLCDAENYTGEFADRPYTNVIEPGKSLTVGYSLTMHNEMDEL
ncbi:MAG: aldose 1-epimerase family protein [Bacteroidaceae bacterium]